MFSQNAKTTDEIRSIRVIRVPISSL